MRNESIYTRRMILFKRRRIHLERKMLVLMRMIKDIPFRENKDWRMDVEMGKALEDFENLLVYFEKGWGESRRGNRKE
jgi:hypothetical protein